MEDSDQQSGAFIGSNDDLLTEILLRLPVKSILRFKSVSKHWSWLLSHRHFTHRYDHDNLSKSLGLYAGNIYVPFDSEDRSAPSFRGFIKASCNGLLLCRSGDDHNHIYYAYNPTTKNIATIPSVPKDQNIFMFMGLAFHQTDFLHYKVVRVSWLPYAFLLHVYSSDTGKWKLSVERFSISSGCIIRKGVYLNGVVHWALTHGKLLSYNIEVEKLHMLNYPVDNEIRYFGESRGHLHLVVAPLSKLHLTVYAMLRDRSGWYVKYQVQLDGLPEMTNPSCYDFNVIDVVRGEKEEDAFMLLSIPGKFIKYNLHHKSFKLIFSFPGEKMYIWSESHRYMPILSSIPSARL
ncbi:F-box protein At5g07610-like [Bidens hawaiensis]|uniref:F-box protein At5g07610-like n=1 Tax=Bidens hawaiensis TaxID=980011 RepID=UPI00404971D3